MTWGGMGGNRSKFPAGPGGDPRQDGRRGGGAPGGENAGWSIFSYLIAGLVAYGGIGWLVAHFTGHPLIFPVGMLIGLALAIVAIMYRYGRS